jgi:hypothetical protein
MPAASGAGAARVLPRSVWFSAGCCRFRLQRGILPRPVCGRGARARRA